MSFVGFIIGTMSSLNNKKLLSLAMGLASGVMLATTIWSLFIPSFEYNINKIIIISMFVFGGIFIIIIDFMLSRFAKKKISSWQKIYFAVTVHNFPEGVVIGIAYGLSLLYKEYSALFALSLAIGLQNLPESIALTIPLVKEGFTKKRIIKLGFVNSIVEPIAATLGFLFIIIFKNGVSCFMSFAAGTMFYVIISEVIPESMKEESTYATIGSLIGFVFMVMLEIFL